MQYCYIYTCLLPEIDCAVNHHHHQLFRHLLIHRDMKTKAIFWKILLILIPFLSSGQKSGDGFTGLNRHQKIEERLNHASDGTFSLMGNRPFWAPELKKSPVLAKSATTVKQRLDRMTYQIYDSSSGKWADVFKQECYYDECCNLCQMISFSKNGSSVKWAGETMESYCFQEKGKISQYLLSIWSGPLGMWLNDYKEDHYYDGRGVLTKSLYSEWEESSGEWVTHFIQEYVLDNHGYIKGSQILMKDSANGKWNLYWKDELFFENGKQSSYITHIWSGDSAKWIPVYRDEYSFNEEGDISTILYYRWSVAAAVWILGYKDQFMYDQYGNMKEFIQYMLDTGTSQWRPLKNEVCTYDNSYSFPELVIPFVDDEMLIYFHHKLTGIAKSEMNAFTKSWSTKNLIHFDYTGRYITHALEAAIPGIQIYPNPASDFLCVKTSLRGCRPLIALYDMKGSQLLSRQVADGERIPLPGFCTGIYVVEISAGDMIKREKLVIEK